MTSTRIDTDGKFYPMEFDSEVSFESLFLEGCCAVLAFIAMLAFIVFIFVI